jgi:tetratricopeptide (TPR) repeat protein
LNAHLQRGLLLMQQNRNELAEQELRQSLAEEPQSAVAHAFLADCLCNQEKFSEATDEARQAIHLEPDLPFAHYVHARILSDRNYDDEALAAIREAVRLDPSDADYCAFEAGLLIDRKQFQEALSAAERGLQNDPEHVASTNMRAMALRSLGREDEGHATLATALKKSPESAVTHANQGWALLQDGRPKEALEHFKEALRLDPENDWAKSGIVEALKARNFIYAIFLKYLFFMSRLSRGAQWGIIIGGYVGNNILRSVARSNPTLDPWIMPIRILYLAFVILTWTAHPLFDLLLRLNRFGRLALTREQIVASNWIGSTLALALLCLAGMFLTTAKVAFLLAALVFAGLIIPLAATFRMARGWPRQVMAAYTAAMALAGLFAVSAHLGGDKQTASAVLGFFLIALFLSSWLANWLGMQRVKR